MVNILKILKIIQMNDLQIFLQKKYRFIYVSKYTYTMIK